MKNITVIGGGVIGSQIAFQTAYCGFNVTIWLREECSKDHTRSKLEKVKASYEEAIHKMNTKGCKTPELWCNGISDYESFNEKECLKKVDNAYKNLKMTIDLKEAVESADLIIESVAEDLNLKQDMVKRVSEYLKDNTIMVTNSSTIMPSKLSKYCKNPDKFLSLHFANSIWKNNMVEVMPQKDTSEESFKKVLDFSTHINMIPLSLKKEKSGYLLNSMLVPFLFAGLDLYVNGVSEPEDIDKAWTLATGAPKGPFQIIDTVGIQTAYNIVQMYVKVPSFLAPYNFKGMSKLLKKYIDEGKMGKSSGEGFYKYK